jgi:hypothetical protein
VVPGAAAHHTPGKISLRGGLPEAEPVGLQKKKGRTPVAAAPSETGSLTWQEQEVSQANFAIFR